MNGPTVSDNSGGLMIRVIPVACRVAVLLLFVVPILVAAAPAPRNLAAGYGVPHTLPFGVADPAGKTGHLLRQTGGLSTLTLQTPPLPCNPYPPPLPLA